MTEYKQKNDLPDLYHILGLTIDVCKDPKCNEIINKAYLRKAKACHPDKHPDRKDIQEVFELITNAYDILKDEQTRTAYNHKLSLNKQSSGDFFKLKKGTVDYMDALGELKPPSDQQKIDFRDRMRLLDDKHGYDPTMIEPINQNDARKKLNELTQTRSEQDRTLLPEKLFDEGRFDLKKFNAAFDMTYNHSENSLVSHNGLPSAWNDSGSTISYSNFDNLDNLYVDDGNRFDTSKQTYAGIDFGATKKITKDNIKDVRGADYVSDHNKIDDNYYAEMKAKLRERKTDSSALENIKYGDFKRDDTAGYGIFDQLGIKFDDRLALDVDEDDISNKYEKLMVERQQDLLVGPAQSNFVPQKNKSKINQSR